MLHAIARGILQGLNLYGLYSLWVKGPLREDGWFRSFEEGRSVDRAGNPLPFITYPAIEFLSRRVTAEMSVFEYGSGASTLWWARRAREVVACEHNREWFEKVRAGAPPNVTLLFHELEYGGDYSKAILQFQNRFDIVVIDGRDRVNCAKNALTALKPSGVIVWDNSDRVSYEAGYHFLQENGFRKVEFIGLSPIRNEKSETTVFYRPHNCLGL